MCSLVNSNGAFALVQAATSQEFDLSQIGTLFREIKCLLRCLVKYLSCGDFAQGAVTRQRMCWPLQSGAGSVYGDQVLLWSSCLPVVVSGAMADDIVVRTS